MMLLLSCVAAQLVWVQMKDWSACLRHRKSECCTTFRAKNKADPLTCHTELTLCNQYLTIKKMLEPIRQIEILLKANWSDWNSNASAITDKRFGEAEEESHTVN